jgi:sterol desaturase/sphingolipid hydroxylase (fatty acid hydroxylase superfamily)
VARAFAKRRSPKLIGCSLSLVLASRLLLAHWSWRDAVLPAALVACEPLTEWVIHSYLLHARPILLAGRSYELLAAREHRAHHEAPTVLDGVLVPVYALMIFLPAIAAVLFGLSFPLHLLIAGERIAWWLSGVFAGYAILLGYEWCHFLIHTPYRPRRRYYATIWRNHRLHHYKNERYWFGVTSNLGDIALGTNPAQRRVPKSQTARTLGPT